MIHYEPTEEECAMMADFMQRRREYLDSGLGLSQVSPENEALGEQVKKFTLLGDLLAKEQGEFSRRAKEFIQANLGAHEPAANGQDSGADQVPDCQLCKEVGFVAKGKAREVVPCPTCSWVFLKKAFDERWPLAPKIRRMSQTPLRSRQFPAVKQLLRACHRLTKTWPAGALVMFVGHTKPAYGTGKTHALARIWRAAWQAQKTAIFTTAPELEKKFTSFKEEEEYEQTLAQLYEVDVLLVDEAHRMTHQDGNSWVERHLFSVVDHLLKNDRIVVLAANSLMDVHPAIVDRAYDNEEGALIVDLSEVKSYRKRHIGSEKAIGLPNWMR